MKKNNLYKLAKKIILGGSMLLSKRPELYLPDLWPSYFSKAKETYVWDMENKKYTDMICAVGQNTLGYTNKKVDTKIISVIKNSNMSTLNCPEEVELSKKLISIHPWAGMAKYARSGGEANSIAIRIARAASKKDHVAICGYHGWHDWYLSANLSSTKKLDNHLLPGLNPLGVPKNLKNLTHPFEYNKLDDLLKIVKKYDIGTIKMEVSRNQLPNKNFLKEVRNLCNKKKIILIFDECTSGFRRNFGGLHLTQNVEPDLAMFGKALGNGYAITAVIGNKSVMKKAESSFISSTFWTERIGFAAGIVTLEEMERLKSWEKLCESGRYLNINWRKLAEKHGLKIKISGIEAITSFQFNYKNNLAYKTFLTQEMLKFGYLASDVVYLNIFHTKKIIDSYLKHLDKIFQQIKKFEVNKVKASSFLKSKICHNTFRRLN